MNKVDISNSFRLSQDYKTKYFKSSLSKLTNFHFKNCKGYKKILQKLSYNPNKTYKLKNLPYLSVRLFKKYDLFSIKKKDIFKILNSSSTTSNQPSKIYLDKKNAIDQSVALTKIYNSFFGKKRYPMLIIDNEKHLKNRNQFNARSAAVLGFSKFGRNITFALNDKMKVNFKKIKKFLNKHKNEKIIIFGFTFIIWENFYKHLKNKIKFNNSILIHGGGWKKLENQEVSNKKFKYQLKKHLSIKKVHNYYGMVEQTGSIFFECHNCENFIASDYSDIIIRDKNFNVLKKNKTGFIQLLSTLPTSYPGNNILTEDLGYITKNNGCKFCSNFKGKRFKVVGRIKDSEARGCSDV